VIGNGLVSGMKAEILARINDGSFGASYREFSRNNGVLTPKHKWYYLYCVINTSASFRGADKSVADLPASAG
jgi:hypothetical protein